MSTKGFAIATIIIAALFVFVFFGAGIIHAGDGGNQCQGHSCDDVPGHECEHGNHTGNPHCGGNDDGGGNTSTPEPPQSTEPPASNTPPATEQPTDVVTQEPPAMGTPEPTTTDNPTEISTETPTDQPTGPTAIDNPQASATPVPEIPNGNNGDDQSAGAANADQVIQANSEIVVSTGKAPAKPKPTMVPYDKAECFIEGGILADSTGTDGKSIITINLPQTVQGYTRLLPTAITSEEEGSFSHPSASPSTNCWGTAQGVKNDEIKADIYVINQLGISENLTESDDKDDTASAVALSGLITFCSDAKLVVGDRSLPYARRFEVDCNNPDWSPDAYRDSYWIVDNDSAGRVFIISEYGMSLQYLGFNGKNPHWSPDGTKIVFAGEGGLAAFNFSDQTTTVIDPKSFDTAMNPSGELPQAILINDHHFCTAVTILPLTGKSCYPAEGGNLISNPNWVDPLHRVTANLEAFGLWIES